jgi:hypothetical protein
LELTDSKLYDFAFVFYSLLGCADTCHVGQAKLLVLILRVDYEYSVSRKIQIDWSL